MTFMSFLRSPRVAFVVMSFLVAAAIVFGHAYFGWLGVGLVGLLGLVISMRAEMFEDCADPHERAGADMLNLYARDLENRRTESSESPMRRQGESFQRYVMHRVINTIFAAIAMLGGAMYVVREL